MTTEKFSFPKTEQKILALWEKHKCFERQNELIKNRPQFVFHDGPPFATGLPHYGHILSGTIKDTVTRYAIQRGYSCTRRFGWDCHGLPVEYEIDKINNITTRKQIIEEIGISNYNKMCKSIVLKYTEQWESIVKRMARWVDFRNGYRTMDISFMESIWYVFSQIYDLGRVYRGYRVMAYSTACSTPLSNFEANQNYKQVSDPSIVVKFTLKSPEDLASKLYGLRVSNINSEDNCPQGNEPGKGFKELTIQDSADTSTETGNSSNVNSSDKSSTVNSSATTSDNSNTVNSSSNVNSSDKDDLHYARSLLSTHKVSLLIWTTTPWTLPANLGCCVCSDFEYVLVLGDTECFILLEERMSAYKQLKNCKVLAKVRGSDLVGMRYMPVFMDYSEQYPNMFQVLDNPNVDPSAGTGIIPNSPAFGEEDYGLFINSHLLNESDQVPCPLDEKGIFCETAFKGLYFKDADNHIINFLKKNNLLVNRSDIVHRYPFCWRSDTPLIYRLVPNWFIRLSDYQDTLVNVNEHINWTPSNIKTRFSNWLASARDWSISRNRFWGTPIPIWTDEKFETLLVIRSVDHLESVGYRIINNQRHSVTITDLHREFIDDILIDHEGKTLKRIDEVFDCWFESGAMPYAQDHWPFRQTETVLVQGGTEQDKKRDLVQDDSVQRDLVQDDSIQRELVQEQSAQRDIVQEQSAQKESVQHNQVQNATKSVENTDRPIDLSSPFKKGYITAPKPADFISEGLDQTRGWFYTLHVISTLLFNRPSFKNIVCFGIVLAEDGKKMSKRLKNYPDPLHIADTVGVDALRLYLISTPVVEAENLKFKKKGVEDVLKNLMINWLNCLNFYRDTQQRKETTAEEQGMISANGEHSHRNSAQQHSEQVSYKSEYSPGICSDSIFDKWILNEFSLFCSSLLRAMDKYELSSILPLSLQFIENLSNWYIRMNRDRLREENTTLQYILRYFSVCMAPYTPYFSEYSWMFMNGTLWLLEDEINCNEKGTDTGEKPKISNTENSKSSISHTSGISTDNGNLWKESKNTDTTSLVKDDPLADSEKKDDSNDAVKNSVLFSNINCSPEKITNQGAPFDNSVKDVTSQINSVKDVTSNETSPKSDQAISNSDGPFIFQSVHYQLFPVPLPLFSCNFSVTKRIIEAIRGLREKAAVSLKTPLYNCRILVDIDLDYDVGIIKEECNLLEMEQCSTEGYEFSLTIKPNYSGIKRHNQDVKGRIAEVTGIKTLEQLNEHPNIKKEEYFVVKTLLYADKENIHTTIDIKHGDTPVFVSLILDLHIDQHLLNLKTARELNSFIQKLRKQSKLHKGDKVTISIENKQLERIFKTSYTMKEMTGDDRLIAKGYFDYNGGNVRIGLYQEK